MKLTTFFTLTCLIFLVFGVACRQDKSTKRLAFVTNNASDFWTIARKGTEKAAAELPDVTVYVEALSQRVQGQKLLGVRVASPFVVRTFDPPLSAAAGLRVLGIRRLGKRIVFELVELAGTA